MSARTVGSNIAHRLAGTTLHRPPGYVPPEIDYVLGDSSRMTISVRDSDVRFLDRVAPATALEHVDLIHRARGGDVTAACELDRRTRATGETISARFAGRRLTENEWVVPYTSAGRFSEAQVSHKGAILLRLTQKGFATADFALLTAGAAVLPDTERDRCVRDAIEDLETLTGRQLGSPGNPLLIALRSAMPAYIPGFMPTYLNVGLTPDVLPGLPARYGADGAARIRLNSRRTLLEALDLDAFASVGDRFRPNLSRDETEAVSGLLEEMIASRAPSLLEDAHGQVRFFVNEAYRFYRSHLDVLGSFTMREMPLPAIIVQRMVCSAIDERSYAGIVYSRHPSLGRGVFLQYARAVFGEELMTGRLSPQERHLVDRDEAREQFPALYHFWPRLFQLEDIFGGPVMVEFTGVHGTFTILQVNAAELSGPGMLTAVMDMHRAGTIGAERVRELIRPYHVRQIESDAIDPRSIRALERFGIGLAVLPQSAVTGRLVFSVPSQGAATGNHDGGGIVLAKRRFTPQDAMDMQRVGGICSLSPAAIHVVTTAQNLGIPSLLNLEGNGVRIDEAKRCLTNSAGRRLREGDWVTISSRTGTLYAGRAVLTPARLLRMMAGETVELSAAERPRFEQLARDYGEYRAILEAVDASEFSSLQDLGHAIRYGELRDAPERAREFVNHCCEQRAQVLVERLLETTLGMHLVNQTAFDLLTDENKSRLLKLASFLCLGRRLTGYQAGAFVVGSLVSPEFPAAFWTRFQPHEVAFLINEWVLHEKYLHVLQQLGEKHLRRAREAILAGGLSSLPNLPAVAGNFMTLKLSGTDLEQVGAAIPARADDQTSELIGLLRRPFGAFFDFDDARSVSRLERLCTEAGRPVPDVEAY